MGCFSVQDSCVCVCVSIVLSLSQLKKRCQIWIDTYEGVSDECNSSSSAYPPSVPEPPGLSLFAIINICPARIYSKLPFVTEVHE